MEREIEMKDKARREKEGQREKIVCKGKSGRGR